MAPGTSPRLDANLKWLFTELPFDARFEAAAAAGFAGVEYASPYQHPASALRRRLADSGLQQVLINSPAGPADSLQRSGTACQPDRVPEFRAGLLKALEYASELDCGVVHVLGGIRPADVSPDLAFATYTANLAWAAEQAAGLPVTLVLEAINRRDVPGFVLGSLEQAAAVVHAVGSERVRLLFDVYHCQVGQGDVTTRLEALLPLVAHVQVADAPLRSEPGTGELAWEFVFGTLRRLAYAGWIGCEYQPVAGTIDGLGWRERFGF